MSTRTPAPKLKLDRELGTGTSGRVWHGELLEPFEGHPAGFEVAVKYLHERLEKDPAALAAFEMEARAGRATRHPGLVHALYSGRDAKGLAIVMRYVPGRTLREVLREGGPLPEPLLRGTGKQIAAGLAALHRAGYIHGDLKPENIRLDAEGRAVLLDLGFAHPIVEQEGVARVRTVVPGAGSLPYLAPEQARGERGGAASDVFALGVVLYELATGLHPFFGAAHAALPSAARAESHVDGAGSSGFVARMALERPDADRLLAAIATARHLVPSRFVPQLSPFIDRLLGDLLQRDPERRPSSDELAQRLSEQENGAWWRSVIQFEAGERRGGTGEFDAQHLLPLVGREEQLRVLFAALAGALGSAAVELPPTRSPVKPANGGAVVWIEGPAGAGKSRLVNEFVSRARASENPPLYLYGRCRELEEDRPCHPILRLLERFLRLPPGARPRERERELLAKLVPPRVSETLCAALDPEHEGTTPLSIPVALAVWLATLARQTPLVVFLDDLNWAGEDTLEVLGRAADELAGSRLLLVLARRTEAQPRAPDALSAARARLAHELPVWELTLGAVDEAAVDTLVRALFHHSAPRLRLASVLWQRSRGNPGLLAEILRGMLARGEALPHADGGELVLTIAPDELPLPSSLQKAISASYKRLSAFERSWVRRLAVVGGRIETDFLVRTFHGAKEAEIDAILTRLVRLQWLVPTGARYRFARPAQREAVYQSLSREQRLRLHAAAAEALAPPVGETASLEDSFQRAFHLRAAEDHVALLALLGPLLARLLRAGQPQRVHSLALWGLEALEKLPRSRDTDRQRIELLEAAVDAADRLGFRSGQRELLDRLSDLEFDPDLDPEAVGRVYLLHGRYAVSTGQYGLARGMLRNAVHLFEKSGRTLELAEALRRLALVQSHVGELDDARKLARSALEHSQHQAQRALAHVALGNIDVLDDEVERALEHSDSALARLRADRGFHLPGAFAAAYMLRARIYRGSGSPARALASASRAVRLARIAGERRLEAEATARLGGLLLDLDRPEEAEARLREALRLAEEIEDRRGQALASLFLGILLWEAADPEAAALLARAAELAVEIGLNRIAAVSEALQARVAREAGQLERALAHAERARASLERFGAELADRVVIAGTLALVQRSLGNDARADEIEKGLRKRVAGQGANIRSPLVRLRQMRAAERLLDAVLSPDGPVYPRVRLEGPVAET